MKVFLIIKRFQTVNKLRGCLRNHNYKIVDTRCALISTGYTLEGQNCAMNLTILSIVSLD